jgi:hypothetical protein
MPGTSGTVVTVNSFTCNDQWHRPSNAAATPARSGTNQELSCDKNCRNTSNARSSHEESAEGIGSPSPATYNGDSLSDT